MLVTAAERHVEVGAASRGLLLPDGRLHCAAPQGLEGSIGKKGALPLHAIALRLILDGWALSKGNCSGNLVRMRRTHLLAALLMLLPMGCSEPDVNLEDGDGAVVFDEDGIRAGWKAWPVAKSSRGVILIVTDGALRVAVGLDLEYLGVSVVDETSVPKQSWVAVRGANGSEQPVFRPVESGSGCKIAKGTLLELKTKLAHPSGSEMYCVTYAVGEDSGQRSYRNPTYRQRVYVRANECSTGLLYPFPASKPVGEFLFMVDERVITQFGILNTSQGTFAGDLAILKDRDGLWELGGVEFSFSKSQGFSTYDVGVLASAAIFWDEEPIVRVTLSTGEALGVRPFVAR